MSDEERKKVALRFLKETGLLHMWKQYIQDCSEKKHSAFCNWKISKDNWYKTNFIATGGANFEEYSIFGNTCFTDYLLFNGVSLDMPCYCYYAAYLIEKGYIQRGKWKIERYVSREKLLRAFPNRDL